MQEELENQTEATEAAMAADGAVEETEAVEASTVESVADVAADTSEEGEAGYKPHRKIRTGTVVSDKMEKSILVKVTRRVSHPLYKKYFFKSKKFMVHDENNDCRIGDTVRIIETRPLSARKRWNLDKIVERAK